MIANMGGTKSGGIKASLTNRELYGDDWYEQIGAVGGRNGNTGGFAADRALAARAGRIGGLVSRRGALGSSTRPQIPEDQKTCTFCAEHGHSALYCAVRANVKQRKLVIAAKRRVEQEERQETINKLNRIDLKYGKARPW